MHGNFTDFDILVIAVLALAAFYIIFIRRDHFDEYAADNRGKTLIEFSCDGCMAHDWHELNRGEIVGKFHRRSYDGGSGTLVGFYLVEREDGSRFEVLEPHCQRGTAEMQPRTDNPDEPLEGKIVCLH